MYEITLFHLIYSVVSTLNKNCENLYENHYNNNNSWKKQI